MGKSSLSRAVSHRFRVRRILIVAGALVVLATASACASGGRGQAAGSSAAPVRPALPGIREFGLNDQEFAAHVEKVQSVMAACMKEAGFEYVPVDVATIERAQASVRKEPGLSRREYKQKWGLAVTTRFDNPVRAIGLGQQNVHTIESLSAPARVAYEHTLFGEQRDSDFAFTFDEEDFERTGGCTRKAVAAAFTPEQLEGTFVSPKDVLVRQDPRIVAAQDKWTSCMQDAGYNYEKDQDAIIKDFTKRLDALTEGDNPATLTGERRNALHALQADEIKVSLADLDCQEKYTDAVFRQVEIEIFGRPVSG